MPRATIGQLLIQDALPEKFQRQGMILDGKGIKELFTRLAEEGGPEVYRDTGKKLMSVAKDVIQRTGAYSFGPEDLLPSPRAEALREQMRRDMRGVFMTRSSPSLIDDLAAWRRKQIINVASKYRKQLEDVGMEDAVAAKNPLAMQVFSGSRGNKTGFKSLTIGDGLYEDAERNVVPIPIFSSYSDGLKDYEYFAGSYGARAGVVDTKLSVASSGFLNKQLSQASHDLVVTGLDDPEEDDDPDDGEEDKVRRARRRLASSFIGLPAKVNDPDNVGAVLAQDAGPYKRNQVLEPFMLKRLQGLGVEKLLVRSPIAARPGPGGGLFARDLGVREKDALTPLGTFVGLEAAQSVGEGVTQSALCLDEDTEVRMADSSARKIKDIRAGELVLGIDFAGRTFPVTVLAVHANGLRDVSEYVFERRPGREEFDYISVVATGEHKFLFRYADGLKLTPITSMMALDKTLLGALCLDVEGDGIGLGRLHKIGWVGTERQTYDLEVDHPDHMFVLANGLCSENSSKHSGGVAGAGSKLLSGFDRVQALLQVPQQFPGGATHSKLDGRVLGIDPAPQGGQYVNVGGQRHYVPAGLNPTVKLGQTIEAGDTLSEGEPNPREILEHKGLGEARRYLVSAMGDYGKRRNLEVLARGLMNHVELDDEIEGLPQYTIGDVVPYDLVARNYEPPDDIKPTSINDAENTYLTEQILHHTIGTKLKPSMLKEMKEFGITEVHSVRDPLPFRPVSIRAMDMLQHHPDWMTRQLGSGLKKGLLDSAQRGGSANPLGTSYVPSIALEPDKFGMQGLTRGYNPALVNPQPLRREDPVEFEEEEDEASLGVFRG